MFVRGGNQNLEGKGISRRKLGPRGERENFGRESGPQRTGISKTDQLLSEMLERGGLRS